MKKLRPSSIGLASRCPASQLGDVHIDHPNPAAELGTACHEWIAGKIRGEAPDFKAIAARYSVDPAELGPLCGWAWHGAWPDLSDWFPNPETEVRWQWIDIESQVEISGTMDVSSLAKDGDGYEVRVADWKTGWLEADAEAQMRAYALLGLKRYTEAQSAYACVIHVRDRCYEAWRWSRGEIEAWWKDLLKRITNGGYSPGHWCAYCPRGHDCPAKTGMMSQAVSVLTSPRPPWDEIEDEQQKCEKIGAVLDRIRVVDAAIKSFRELIRVEVDVRGGRMDIGDGRQVVIAEANRTNIDPGKAIPILVRELGQITAHSVVKVEKTKMETEVKNKYPRGEKGKAIKALMEKLDGAGALSTTTFQRMEVRRKVPEIEREVSNVDQP